MERGALWAIAPVVAIVPFSALALFVFWLPLGLVTPIRYWWVVVAFAVAGLALFVRPVQVAVLTPVLGARRPTPIEVFIFFIFVIAVVTLS